MFWSSDRDMGVTPQYRLHQVKSLAAGGFKGKQFRSFTLAHDIDESKSEVAYNDSMRKLTLPKEAGSETKKLAIK
jgi:HSP20 family molecular chaperone IbpA